jgi:hypothetical protein
MGGSSVSDIRVGEYAFCKNAGITKPQMDEMDEEDVLSFSWCMRIEAKSNKG